MVVSIIALIAALAGTAWAAKKIGTKQLKNNAVKTKKLANGAVTNPKLGNDAVNAAKIAGGSVGKAELGSDVLVAEAIGRINYSGGAPLIVSASSDGIVSATEVNNGTDGHVCIDLASPERMVVASAAEPGDIVVSVNQSPNIGGAGLECPTGGGADISVDLRDGGALVAADLALVAY